MYRRIATMALMAATLLLACPAMAQHAHDEPLSAIPGQPHSWLGQTRINAAGHSEVWIWAFTPGLSPNGFAFLTEFDCDSRTARRLRHEKYDGSTLVETAIDNDTFHVWDSFYVERRATGLVCDRTPLGETVANRAEALLRRPRDQISTP